MVKAYFTFGSDPAYPCGRGEYITAIGTDRHDCIEAFRKKHPNRSGSDAYNAADCYNEKQWEEISEKYYKDKPPKEFIVSDNVYGCKPDGFDPIWFYVPSQSALIYLQEGSGDNLTDEDREEGNVDYLDYTIFSLENGEVREFDGGEIMFGVPVRSLFGCLADAIPEVMDDTYDDTFTDAQILKGISA